MRLSCNGCRVLRKGCNEKCSIKPCLQWIKSPEAQSNATLFLAKFYGRAGLLNLINSGPDHLRPAIFSSLLYEACGRIVNPIYGSAGLLTSGNWQLCQAAVDAVLSGASIEKLSPDSAANTVCPSLKVCDIRHVSKENDLTPDLHKVKVRTKFKRVSAKPQQRNQSPEVDYAARVMWSWSHKEEEVIGSPSRDSGLSQQREGESGDADSGSVETVEASLAKLDESDVGLELTLGLQPLMKSPECGATRS
ncbi:LOB domain-containing protein 41-like [Nicotiana tabacum]|uniref:LOB domain-containing protein 40-like n=1 Tax=Nicotiana tabacum TaxID=4097 RepID=A0A1S4AMS3_TOBAC|nr:PREDICTED: LOB domain-containing protein 40-like [Nicotiana tabacum]